MLTEASCYLVCVHPPRQRGPKGIMRSESEWAGNVSGVSE